MDDPAANKSHASCQWAGQNGWTAAPAQHFSQTSAYNHPFSSTSLFHSPAVFASPRTIPLSQQSARSSRRAPQPTQASQHAPLLSHTTTDTPSFQTPSTNQGPADGLQGPLSCRLHEAQQWIPPAATGTAVSESLEAQTDQTPRPARNSGGGQRSMLLRQRAQLLLKLAEMEVLLESTPPDDDGDHQPPHMSAQSHPECGLAVMDGGQEVSRDTLDPQTSVVKAEEEDIDAEFLPDSDDNSDDGGGGDDDGDLPRFKSDGDSWSSGNGGSRPSSPTNTRADPESSVNQRSPSPGGQDSRPLQPKPSETVVQPFHSSKKRRVQKRNYCLFCRKPVIKMSRHMERAHSDKVEVAVAFQHPKNSRERMKIWNKLINQGNFLHNKEVLKTGRGELVVRKRPQTLAQSTAFLHCLHCHGLFLKKFLFRHMNHCPQREKSAAERRVGKKRVASRCALQMVVDLGISDGVRSVLSDMVYDKVTQTIMEDRLILQFAQQMLERHGADAGRHMHIRQNLRQIARLVMEAQKSGAMKTLEHFFYPSNFHHVVSTVNSLAGYEPERKRYRVPSLALKLGFHLQKTCSIVEANAQRDGDARLAESARTFLSEYQEKWTGLISSGALTSLKDIKSQTEQQVPLVQDVKRLHFHLEDVQPLAERKLRERRTVQNYTALCKATLCRLIMFNRRTPRQISHLRVQDFASRKRSGALDDMDQSVSHLEKTLCDFFVRIDIRATSGRMVPVLLTPSMVSALELLLSSRGHCGVPADNPFLFARPSALTPYKGCTCLLAFVRECGAENPEALSAATIRKHFPTMLQLMNLDEREAGQILGPDNDVQILWQKSEATVEDQGCFSLDAVRLQKGPRLAAWRSRAAATAASSKISQQARQAAASSSVSDRTASSRAQGEGCQQKTKQKWQQEEVLAVERHLLRFIREHRLPQKEHCMQCLQAEPRALRSRTWRGVKDYVRNRITTLKRQKSSSAKLWRNRYQPEEED